MKEFLNEIHVKQGRTVNQICRVLGISTTDGVGFKQELIANGEIYEHPVTGGLYVKQKSATPNKPKPVDVPIAKPVNVAIAKPVENLKSEIAALSKEEPIMEKTEDKTVSEAGNPTDNELGPFEDSFSKHHICKLTAFIKSRLESGPLTFEELFEGCKYNVEDCLFVLRRMSARQHVISDNSTGKVRWRLVVSRASRRLKRSEILKLFDEKLELSAAEIANRLGRESRSLGTILSAMTIAGEIVRVSVHPSIYRRPSDIGLLEALEQINSISIPRKCEIEKPKEDWLPVLVKLQQTLGGPAGAIVGEVHAYLLRQLVEGH